MTDAPKIDTQAPRIGVTAGIDFSTGKDTTMLTLMIDGKVDHASTDGPWGQAILSLLAERDLAAARAAAAAQAMQEALRDALAWIDAVPSDMPLPAMPGFDRDAVDELMASSTDPAALDRLIAERVREAFIAMAVEIEAEEREASSWGGPDPRGIIAAQINLGFAKRLRARAAERGK